MRSTHPIDVFYDGHCPVCVMEVGWYGRVDRDGTIRWIDIMTLGDGELPVGKSRDDLLRRFHVRDEGGDWHVGVDAFARIWQALPGLHHIAFVFRLPVIRPVAELAYRGFLRWQRWHRARRVARDATHQMTE